MKPYYEDTESGITIYHGDCRDILPQFPDKSFDLVITSPPYNLGNNHHTNTKRHDPYDDDMPEHEYQKEQIWVMMELYRVLGGAGWLFYNHKNRIRDGKYISPLEWIRETPFERRQEINWNNGTPNMDKRRFFPFSERIYCLSKIDSVMENRLGLTDDWHIAPEGTNGKHTRAFPLEIPTRLMSVVTFQNALDPYAGSGTTAVAAKKLGRKCTLIEIEEKYCEIAVKRLAQTQMQFAPAKKQEPEHPKLFG